MKKKLKKKIITPKNVGWVVQLFHPESGWCSEDRIYTWDINAELHKKWYEECGAKARVKKVKLT